MTESVTIAVAQFAPTADAEANLDVMTELATSAVRRGASLVVFPEYSSWFAPEFGPDWTAAAQPIDGEFVTRLGALASSLGAHLVAGLVESAEESRVSNTLVAVDASGQLVATYRKLHLYDAFGAKESDWVVPGDIDEPHTFSWGGFTVGLQTCYDIRFPEVSRRLVDAGADLLLVPAEWVRGPLKEHHWRTLVTARALENTVFVAAADHIPPVGVGNSMVIDPMGVELVTIGEQTAAAVVEISPARIREVRTVNPALSLRRFRVV
ncbi:MAG: carbon-nitrogen hydrolase family protein [Rhodoglobus sp.]